MTENPLRSVAEALLFASEKPLTIDQIRKVIEGVDTAQARLLVEEIMHEYDEQKRGIRVVEIAGGYQMITAPEFSSYLRKMYKDRSTDKLSKPALETLAIIAYKQPLTKVEIEALRNVNVDGVIKSLLDKMLVRICGRRKVPGRPLVYGTTRQFLEYFGLKSLEDLPKIEELSILNEKVNAESAAIEPIPEEPETAAVGTVPAPDTEEIHEPAQPQEENRQS